MNGAILKKAVFSEKLMKNYFGGTFDDFLGKGGVLLQKLISLFYHKLGCWIFYYLVVVLKNSCIFRETQKNRFGVAGKSLLKGRGCRATKKNISFFMENKVLIVFSSNNFFEESNILREYNKKKNFWGTWRFFRRIDLHQKWI